MQATAAADRAWPVIAARHSSIEWYSGDSSTPVRSHPGSWLTGKNVPENIAKGITTNRSKAPKAKSFSRVHRESGEWAREAKRTEYGGGHGQHGEQLT